MAGIYLNLTRKSNRFQDSFSPASGLKTPIQTSMLNILDRL